MLPIDFPMLLADKHATFWFPPAASTFAKDVDWLYMAILYISTFFFVAVVVTMIVFVIKYRRRPGYQGDSRALHNNALEITWTVIPSLIVCWIFAEGVNGYMDMMTPPAETIDINVTARQWDWSFQYPNGAISDQLHIPIDQAIRLNMRSEDVLHAFYAPAFRAKSDIVPGRVVEMWFKPILEGEFDLFCAEYCGDLHSDMIKRHGVVVHDQAGYDAWLAEASKPPVHPVAHGFWLYQRLGCASCHSTVEGKSIVGPSFAKSYGKTFKSSKGTDIKFDQQYIRESILEPQVVMREGYQNASQMPSFQGKVNEEQLSALTAFLQALTDDAFLEAIADGELSDADKESLGMTDESAVAESATAEPATEESTTEESAAEEPAAEKSATAESAITDEPASEDKATEESATEKPAAEEPATAEPAVEEPAVEEPAAEEPATEEPATEKPAVEEPAVEEPATEKPAVEEPAAEKPAVEEPAAEEPAAEEQPRDDEQPTTETPATDSAPPEA